MKNTSEKMKKWMTIAGLGIVCCVLIALIGGKFISTPPVDSLPNNTDSSVSDVNPNPDVTTKEPETLIVKPSAEPIQTDNGAISSGTEQTIQPDPVKPSEPTHEEISNPEKPPETKTPTTPAKPADTTPSTPKGGDTNSNGQVYVPGFGWTTPAGGTGSTGDSNGDINKEVGIMGGQ